MAEEKPGSSGGDPAAAAARAARALVRRSREAALATLDRRTGHPYASLVTIATDPDGTPVFLISQLALHTQNLLGDQRASLLIEGTEDTGDPLAGGRVTLIGQANSGVSAVTRSRFLARHPTAASYVDFSDFAFYKLTLERAHFVAGFGRIIDLGPADLLVPVDDAGDLVAGEAEIIAEVNRDRGADIEMLATRLANSAAGRWRLTGIDPAGVDLMFGDQTRRLDFGSRVTTASTARQQLLRLLNAAHPES
jgi:heme iron utilization protein